MSDSQALTDGIEQVRSSIKRPVYLRGCRAITVHGHCTFSVLTVSSVGGNDLSCYTIYPSNQGASSSGLLLFFVPV